MGTPVGFDDANRLASLRDYRILDTPPEAAFDNITTLASKVFQVPIALVTLVDEHRQWFKSRFGFATEETPRAVAFCDVAIREAETLVVPDATQDPRFARNPLVTGDPRIRFYCGVPLRTPDGHALGTLCIIDRQPRAMSSGERGALEVLARQVELELEIRRRLSLLEEALASQGEEQRAREQLASMVVHDLRNPLSVILAMGPTVQVSDPGSLEALDDMMAAAERMRRLLNDLLDVSLSRVGGLKPRRVDFSLASLFGGVERRASHVARERGQTLKQELPEGPLRVCADPELVERVLINLVENAARHGPAGQDITLAAAAAEGGRVRVEVRDHGATIPEERRNVIFRPFERMPATEAQSPRGYGLGLAFCRLAIEAHGGRIAVSPVAGGGNGFHFDLPGAPT
jgi:signal transduction histidine kinase